MQAQAIRSPLGAFVRSPLGVRQTKVPVILGGERFYLYIRDISVIADFEYWRRNYPQNPYICYTRVVYDESRTDVELGARYTTTLANIYTANRQFYSGSVPGFESLSFPTNHYPKTAAEQSGISQLANDRIPFGEASYGWDCIRAWINSYDAVSEQIELSVQWIYRTGNHSIGFYTAITCTEVWVGKINGAFSFVSQTLWNNETTWTSWGKTKYTYVYDFRVSIGGVSLGTSAGTMNLPAASFDFATQTYNVTENSITFTAPSNATGLAHRNHSGGGWDTGASWVYAGKKITYQLEDGVPFVTPFITPYKNTNLSRVGGKMLGGGQYGNNYAILYPRTYKYAA